MERPASSAIPTTPGVYLYKDSLGKIIYVGKARNLRKRILSYFRPKDWLGYSYDEFTSQHSSAGGQRSQRH